MIFQFPSNVFERFFLNWFHYFCRRLIDFFTRDKSLPGNSVWYPALRKSFALQKILNLSRHAIMFSSLVHKEKFVVISRIKHFASLTTTVLAFLFISRSSCATEDTLQASAGCVSTKNLDHWTTFRFYHNVMTFKPRKATSAGFLFESTYLHCDRSELSCIAKRRFSRRLALQAYPFSDISIISSLTL